MFTIQVEIHTVQYTAGPDVTTVQYGQAHGGRGGEMAAMKAYER